ncbi:unnamed protein product [Onchocerca flexuosa]|uniref:C-type lectin domain-containing protein n=1 Tax=Onchocerca flexuosa TaxID=387005 RepID=A0A183H9G7_9BILA|nr:unnamed protein product [Onchocerca flexuosa]
MLETNEFKEGDWKHPVSDFSCNIGRDNSSCNQHLSYDWPWGTLINTSQDAMQVVYVVHVVESFCNAQSFVLQGDLLHLLKTDEFQDSEKYESDNVFTLTSNTDLFNTGNIWSNSDSADSSAFVDDYLGMLCAWEDENYNPLTNCNLTRAEIMNMFHLPSYHLNNQLISQA